jgi:hypothetical protein
MWAILLIAATSTSSAASYDEVRAELESDRQKLAVEYARAKPNQKSAVLDRASTLLLRAIEDELMPAWNGTKWAFEGTSSTPKKGEIACGMFVGTILEHAGFNLERIALGRLASEHIAQTLTAEKNIRRYSLKSVEEVERDVSAWGEGLYIVGLDFHAGFILVDANGEVSMVHSSYYHPQAVRREPLGSEANPFRWSKYRVVAKLLDRAMMKTWLEGQRIASKRTPAR